MSIYTIQRSAHKDMAVADFVIILSMFVLCSLARMMMLHSSPPVNAALTMVLYLSIILIFQKNYMNLVIVMSLLYVFQNIIIGLGMNFAPQATSTTLQTAIAFSSVFGFLIFANLFLSGNKPFIYSHEKWGLFFLILTALYAVYGEFNLIASFGYARNLLLLILIPIIGRIIVKSELDLDRFLGYVFFISFFVTAFGLLERFFFDFDIWHSVFHFESVFQAKGMISGSLHELPALYYTWILDYNVRRMASVFIEPVNLAYFMAVPTVLAFVLRKKVAFVFFGVSLLLTFGKGGWLVAFISILSVFFLGSRAFRNKKNGFLMLFFYSLSVVIGVSFLYFKISPGTALPHLWGLISIERHIFDTPLGHGLGSGGNFASSGSLMESLATGAESGVSTLTYKMGVLGLLAYLMFFLKLGSKLVSIFLKYSNETLGKLALGSAGLVLGLLYGSVYQENPLGPQTNHLILLVAGIVIGVSYLREKKDTVTE